MEKGGTSVSCGLCHISIDGGGSDAPGGSCSVRSRLQPDIS